MPDFFEEDEVLLLCVTSGMGKHQIMIANTIGVIDSDYRGEIIVALHNDTNENQVVPAGSRIAQIIAVPYWSFIWNEVESLDETERGEGGFGSTGTK